MDIFFEIYGDLPRAGPGDDDSTRKALSLMEGLPPDPRILDVGCGPGMQTIALAEAVKGGIVAVDNHQPFLDRLKARAAEAGVASRIETLNRSMFSLGLDPNSFDALWSEGAVYIIGFEKGLREWHPLLKPKGYAAVTELSWLRPDPPAGIRDYFGAEYPAMRTLEANLDAVRAAGYRDIGHFALPDSSWWSHYYEPMERRIVELQAKHKSDAEAGKLLDAARLEIEMFRKYSGWYGYVFYVMRAD